MTYSPGDRVKHPKCPSWGTGRILSVQGTLVMADFENVGSKKLRVDNINLIKLLPSASSPASVSRQSVSKRNSNRVEAPDTEGFRCPPLMVKPMGRRYEQGQTVGKENSSGTMRIFQADSPDAIKVSIGYIEWMNGEKEVKYFDAENNKALIQNCGRLRLGIHECGPGFERVILNQARTASMFAGKGKPTAKKASQDELDQGAGFDTFSFLKKLGAVDIAKRERLLGDESTRKYMYCVKFNKGNLEVPVAAYLITRILPLMKGM